MLHKTGCSRRKITSRMVACLVTMIMGFWEDIAYRKGT